MAKLTILAAAALLALLALNQVSASFRTTITTTVIDDGEENNNLRYAPQHCRQQLQQQQQLRHCQMYLSSQRMGGYDDQNPQHLSDCCRQLRNMSQECRCQNIMEIMRQRQHGQMRGTQEMQEAQNLPSRCNLSPQRCQMRTVSF